MSTKPAVSAVPARPKRAPARRKAAPAVATSESIDNQIATFLASGGEIERIPNGKSGQTYGGPRAGKPAAAAATPAAKATTSPAAKAKSAAPKA